jgi:hypothetical protein
VLGDGALSRPALGRAALGDDGLEVGVPGSEPLGVTADPLAAGTDGEGRGADPAALRGAATGLGGGDGASIAITTDRPTNPIATAAMPYTITVLGDRPRRRDRRP